MTAAHVTADRLDFVPPPQAASPRATALAVGAHLALLAALTWGVNWTHNTPNVVAEAELWASVPVQAAPKPVEAPTPPPAPAVKAPPPAAPALPSAADIALEREKKNQEVIKQRELEMAAKLEAVRKQKEAAQKQAEAKKLAEQKKLEVAKKAADEKAKLAAAKLKQEQEDAKQREALRQENLKRMAGLAGATGAPDATGTALRSAGPSASYAGKIVARVKPNIVFVEAAAGNPVAEVEVRAAPDGTIVGRKIVKSSGLKAWDDAVLKAIDKTDSLPRDTDGRVPSTLIISFRPKD